MRSFSLLATPAIALLAASAVVHTARGRDTDQQIAAHPRGLVEVSNTSGNIEVSGWDQPKVSVHADVSGNTNDVKVKSDHGRTTITVRPAGRSFPFGGDVDLKIKIPRGSELDVTAVSGNVTCTGVSGIQRLKTVSGSIVADIAQSDVDAKSVSGNVTLHGQGKPADLHITSISGNIQLDHGAGDIEASTVGGDVMVQLDSGHSVRVHTASGDMIVRGRLAKGADVDAQTVNGDVKLHASADAGYEYEAQTFSGDIHSCFKAQAERQSQFGPGERLSGSVGGGGGHVRLKTMSGDVELCDKP